jgi:hypothetical protein
VAGDFYEIHPHHFVERRIRFILQEELFSLAWGRRFRAYENQDEIGILYWDRRIECVLVDLIMCLHFDHGRVK